MCEQHKRLASSQLSPESRALAGQMFRSPVGDFAGDSAAAASSSGSAQYADLRKFLVQIMERHIEKKLVTAAMLAKL
jgi:DNA repair protein RecO (recombination protein O)